MRKKTKNKKTKPQNHRSLLFDRVDAATLEPLIKVLDPGQDGKAEGTTCQVHSLNPRP